VVDLSGGPVADATITVDGVARTTSDGQGVYFVDLTGVKLPTKMKFQASHEHYTFFELSSINVEQHGV